MKKHLVLKSFSFFITVLVIHLTFWFWVSSLKNVEFTDKIVIIFFLKLAQKSCFSNIDESVTFLLYDFVKSRRYTTNFRISFFFGKNHSVFSKKTFFWNMLYNLYIYSYMDYTYEWLNTIMRNKLVIMRKTLMISNHDI